jgi:hypothetical protein
MKRISIGFVALLLFLGSAQAQRHSERLDRLSKILGDKIVAAMPGWSHRSIEPIEGSKSVIVEQWEAGNVIVRVAVIEYDTEESAVAASAVAMELTLRSLIELGRLDEAIGMAATSVSSFGWLSAYGVIALLKGGAHQEAMRVLAAMNGDYAIPTLTCRGRTRSCRIVD